MAEHVSPEVSAALPARQRAGAPGPLRSLRALGRAAVFFLKVFPMLPSRPVDWLTRAPVIDRVSYPTCRGPAEGEVYRPPTAGPHPGIVVCLGVVPFGVDHPQVPVLGNALARAGFAALLYWSPAMRAFRLDPEDADSIAMAYDWFVDQPYVDPARSGLLGTCVGGAFALMAAARPLARERIGFVSAYAPFSSMWTFARDIASATRDGPAGREAWPVDHLTREVFVHSITNSLEPAEAERLRAAYMKGPGGVLEGGELSAEGQVVQALLAGPDEQAAEAALRRLPAGVQSDLQAMCPLEVLPEICAPLVVLLHDVGDPVIPVGESRRVVSALDGRTGVQYTEMRFHHLDPSKGKLPLPRLAAELGKYFSAVYPLFRQAVPD